jgi:hypothetical protein
MGLHIEDVETTKLIIYPQSNAKKLSAFFFKTRRKKGYKNKPHITNKDRQ